MIFKVPRIAIINLYKKESANILLKKKLLTNIINGYPKTSPLYLFCFEFKRRNSLCNLSFLIYLQESSMVE